MTIWKKCLQDEKYEVSSDGRVRRNGKELKFWIVKGTGYFQVALSGKSYSVHRLIAEAFCEGKSEDNWMVNHINAIRTDNNAENLEWVTPSYNQKHSYKLGRISTTKGKFGKDHPTSKSIEMLSLNGDVIKKYHSGMDAVREGFDSSSISRCCHGMIRHHRGYKWRFAA